MWSVYQGKPKIYSITLPNHEIIEKNIIKKNCFEIDKIAFDIEAFINGDNVQFSPETVRMDLCSGFQKKVLSTLNKIPRGYASTYKNIARQLNNSYGFRAVGNALANNPFSVIFPCHRVIRSDMLLGGYQGGSYMKKGLLEIEGIEFDDKGRVELKCLLY
ncbi:MAG: methylated-DNA--[protein]-cysteine S-methyltransferase [Candidatus Theseobacter exili]|nr:methylated-DNA--[protein]-cysteine S-methyltransferase [Candidatus Theseobacter exili]